MPLWVHIPLLDVKGRQKMHRAKKMAALAGALTLGLATSAIAQEPPTATYTLSPESGPVGTNIIVAGTTTCPDNPGGPDIEAFFLFGNFAGGDDVNPGMEFEVEDGGGFTGTLVAPDPDDPSFADNSGSTPLENNPTGDFTVEARCTDASGDANSGGITDTPPTFTYTQAPGGGTTTSSTTPAPTSSTTSTTTSSTVAPGNGGSGPGTADRLPQAKPATPQKAQPTFTG
ncbi:MAG: hypothetical protein M3507_06545 [Actinomycetota bacterium]|nr:hypothetical protein [Actinomycetota bacterium]